MTLSKKLKNNLDEHNIIIRLLEEDITELDAGWRKFLFKFKERISYHGSPCHGLTDFDACVISLDPCMTNDLALETLIHEIYHVLLETVGLGGDEEDLVIQAKNEHITSIISRGYMLLVKLNPKLFSLIHELLENQNEDK